VVNIKNNLQFKMLTMNIESYLEISMMLDSINFTIIFQKFLTLNHICIAMASVFLLNVVDRGFESRSDQTKDNKIGICCFSAKHAALRSILDEDVVRVVLDQHT
jgi:hypothetical protein